MTTINDLSEYSKNELLELWNSLSIKQKPPSSIKLLTRELAYRFQEKEYGKLDKNTTVSLRRHMTSFAKSLEEGKRTTKQKAPSQPVLEAGSIIRRQWQGKEYSVKVLGRRLFEYEGKKFKSLSAVARTITGQHLSGPLFFDLKNS